MTNCMFLCQLELDLLAQRGELLMSSCCPGFTSNFRGSNLQGALQLLEELCQAPVSCPPHTHAADARGYSECIRCQYYSHCQEGCDIICVLCVDWVLCAVRCFPVMPAELAWIFATRPIFLYSELLPCVSLDPALYCPRRTSAFTTAEDWYTHTHT